MPTERPATAETHFVARPKKSQATGKRLVNPSTASSGSADERGGVVAAEVMVALDPREVRVRFDARRDPVRTPGGKAARRRHRPELRNAAGDDVERLLPCCKVRHALQQPLRVGVLRP